MTKPLLVALRRLLFVPALATALFVSGAVHAAVITPGTPTTAVPTYLSDGSYPPGITVTLAANQVLLPVEIAGANGLQTWQFDVTFDSTVVQQVDPFDGTSGIYGAQFTTGDGSSLSFILGGLPLNAQGLVDDVAGSYPNLLSGATGDGVLAFILFEYLAGQQTNNPNFGIDNPTVQQAPEPGTMLLLAATLLALGGIQRRRGWRPRAAAR